jgi:hypothetical protein
MKYVTFNFGPMGGTYVVELPNFRDEDPIEVIEHATLSYLNGLEEDLEPEEIIEDVFRIFPAIEYKVHPAHNIEVY